VGFHGVGTPLIDNLYIEESVFLASAALRKILILVSYIKVQLAAKLLESS